MPLSITVPVGGRVRTVQYGSSFWRAGLIYFSSYISIMICKHISLEVYKQLCLGGLKGVVAELLQSDCWWKNCIGEGTSTGSGGVHWYVRFVTPMHVEEFCHGAPTSHESLPNSKGTSEVTPWWSHHRPPHPQRSIWECTSVSIIGLKPPNLGEWRAHQQQEDPAGDSLTSDHITIYIYIYIYVKYKDINVNVIRSMARFYMPIWAALLAILGTILGQQQFQLTNLFLSTNLSSIWSTALANKISFINNFVNNILAG